jgi:hypothetical protein
MAARCVCVWVRGCKCVCGGEMNIIVIAVLPTSAHLTSEVQHTDVGKQKKSKSQNITIQHTPHNTTQTTEYSTA